MSNQQFGAAYGANLPENYERYFVPAIGEPMAADLIRAAALRPGERVLDVACGTGIAAKLAARQVGADGKVAGVDVNPGMLAAARASTPPDISIEWHEASAEKMPLPDESFDVVLCQMGLQFMPDKPGALREMRRVLTDDGRLFLNAPGPIGRFFAVLAEALKRHISPEAAGFVKLVFSLYDTDEIEGLLSGAGFRDISVETDTKTLNLPPPKEFLWQYVWSTPLALITAKADEKTRAALEQEVVAGWKEFESDSAVMYQQPIVQANARN